MRSTSASVVLQPLTLTRIARIPCHVVGPHQHVPSACTAAITASVVSCAPNDTSTWFSTTSLSATKPALRSPTANLRASSQLRSTRSATPSRPSMARATVNGATYSNAQTAFSANNLTSAQSYVNKYLSDLKSSSKNVSAAYYTLLTGWANDLSARL